ncbi:MAG: ABC transporter permease [Chloroflexota bacterium]|nr:ABC transporter permease [Chloroflexota bacterium]
MKLRDCLLAALGALSSHKMRSALTMLGVLIGVAAVISMVSLTKMEQAMVEESFQSLGADLIFITPGAAKFQGGIGGTVSPSATLTLEDAEAIARDAPSVFLVSPVTQTVTQIVAGGENIASTTMGVTPNYQYVRNLQTEQGEFITAQDYQGRKRVVVLGKQLAEDLFGQLSPVGQNIRINGRQFRVIGVLETKGSMFGGEDQAAIVPLSTAQATISSGVAGSSGHSIQGISIQAQSKEVVDSAQWEISTILRQRHHIKSGDDDDFTMISMSDISSTADQMYAIGTIVWGGVAGISLLVGGIGIMNIMLVSVTERIREIGLRKALGAKRRDILIQFLTESAVMSLLGGMIGVFLGWILIKIATIVLASMGYPFSAMLPADVVAIAVGMAVFVGLASGVYPAIRAARLNPIDALHHE